MENLHRSMKTALKKVFGAWFIILNFVVFISFIPESTVAESEIPFREYILSLQRRIGTDLIAVDIQNDALFGAAYLSLSSMSSLVDVVGVWLRYATLTFLTSFKTILFIIFLQQYTGHVLMSLYIMLPDWLTEMTDYMTEAIVATFSTDEGDPPLLELDSRLSLLIPRKEHDGNEVCGSTFLEKYRSDASPRIIDNGDEDGNNKENYVFDSQFGLIPVSCRDVWAQQLQEMEKRRKHAIAEGEKNRRKKNIPPVRFTEATR